MQSRSALLLLMSAIGLLWGSGLPASSQSVLNETQLLGMRLFNQSCRVCHTKPQLTSPQYGPVLSKDSLGGQEEVLRSFISEGTARMPGFKYTYDLAQTDAIVA